MEHMQQKMGGQIPVETLFSRPQQHGAAVGLTFHFEKIEREPNTLLGHRLLALTPPDAQSGLLEDLYAAYFEHGQDIGSLEVLLQVAAARGLETGLLRQQLAGDAGREQVLADVRWAQEHGIHGVPFFVFDEQYGASGALPPDNLLDVFRQLKEKEAE